MADNKKNKGKADRIQVDATDNNEVSYLKRKFPSFRRSTILSAIRLHGPMRKDVVRMLKRKE